LVRKQVAEGAVFASEDARYLLGVLTREGFLSKETVESMASSYDDWQDVFMLVRAGYASDGPNGLLPTSEGRRAAELVFVPEATAPARDRSGPAAG
jgi:hypothetical protein